MSNTDKEVMQKALDALVNAVPCTGQQVKEQADAIAALQTAIAQETFVEVPFWSADFDKIEDGKLYRKVAQPQQSTQAVPPMPEFEVAAFIESRPVGPMVCPPDEMTEFRKATWRPLIRLSDVAAAWPKGTV